MRPVPQPTFWAMLATVLVATSAQAKPALPRLDLINVLSISANARPSPAFGGLSGLDYDASKDLWWAVSDDRSEKAPARLYRLRLKGVGAPDLALEVVDSMPLRTAMGTVFPPPGTGGEAADAEALRIDPKSGDLVWSTEGDARDRFGPAIRRQTTDGRFAGEIPLPAMFGFDPGQRTGPRPNKSFEGLAFIHGGERLWVSMEAPLWQDGPVSSVRSGAIVRLSRLDRDARLLAQYAYPLDPIQASTKGPYADNGVSEILALDDDRLLVLERSGDGDDGYHVRLYMVDTRGAQNVAAIVSLADTSVRPLMKRLLLNFDTLAPLRIDNLEAMAWGPRLPDGARTLVFLSDDNFASNQQTQWLVFRVR